MPVSMPLFMPPRLRLMTMSALLLSVGLAQLAGCARLQVSRLATPDGSVMYDLRGRDPARLKDEAQRLCPQGHEVLRQAARNDALESALLPARAWNAAVGLLDEPGAQAQLVVACRAAPSPAMSPAMSPVMSPAAPPAMPLETRPEAEVPSVVPAPSAPTGDTTGSAK